MPIPTADLDAPNGGDDIRGMIESAFNDAGAADPPIEADATAGAGSAAGEGENLPAASDSSEPKASHPTDAARNADGTFKAKADDKAAEKPATTEQPQAREPAAAKTEQPSADNQAKASAQPSTADAPPAGWTAEAKAEWSNLSPAVKAAAIKRETEIAEGGRQWSEQKRRYEEEWAPLEMRARQLGIPRQEGLNRLLAADHMLRTSPVHAIQTLMSTFGVTLEHLTGQPQSANGAQGGQQVYHDPRVDQLLFERQQGAARDQARLETLVTEFAQSPDHPHFDAVVDHALHLLPAIKASNPNASPEAILQQAYDQAVWANPTTRQALLEQQANRAEEQRRADAAAQTARARAAAVSVTGSANGASAKPEPDTIREALEAAYGDAR